MPQDDDRFEPETGRSRRDSAGRIGARGGKGRDLKGRVLEQVARRGGNPRGGGTRVAGGSPRSGRFNARGRGAKLAASFPKTSGWSFDRGSGMRVRPRRVTVKARVVKLS
ncbi:type IV secretion system protein VirD2, partial [Novosphingobium sp. 1949]|nr:type IV secretion system protein VirD2 [Novosphingobium organovorum]